MARSKQSCGNIDSLIEISMITCALILGILSLLILDETYPCKPYIVGNRCFDVNVRCDGECYYYHMNFTGKMDRVGGCGCDCGDMYVSYCSGLNFSKEIT